MCACNYRVLVFECIGMHACLCVKTSVLLQGYSGSSVYVGIEKGLGLCMMALNAIWPFAYMYRRLCFCKKISMEEGDDPGGCYRWAKIAAENLT